MGRGTWSWIVPDGLWELARPSIPQDRARPQGGGTPNTPDETLFAAIIYVLVSGCALPPCFGISKATAHRRFMTWSRAGVWGRLHEAVLHELDDAGLIDVSRVVLEPARGWRNSSAPASSALHGLHLPNPTHPHRASRFSSAGL